MATAATRIRQSADRTTRLIGLLASCSLLTAAPPAEAGATPGDLQGIWEREQATEPSDHPRVVEIGDGLLRADGVDCRIAGLRSLSNRRWYLDATCGSGESAAIVQLDLLLLDEGRLVLARRILGTAELYRRRARTLGQGAG